MCAYELIEKGKPNSTDYSIYYKNRCGNLISPLHDIPLFAHNENDIYNMVVEIPRWTNAKMEMSLKSPLNPIKHAVYGKKLCFVSNFFPHKGYIWNYGALPQTWQDPHNIESTTGCKGDNEPIDVVEIGYRVAKCGEVLKVKILGAIAVIDEDATDWKIIAIDINDPDADELQDINDVYEYFPNLLRATAEWFQIYKITDGKPQNQVAFNGEPINSATAQCIIEENHKNWQGLISQSEEDYLINRMNTTLKFTPNYVLQDKAGKVLNEAPENAKPEEISDLSDRWHFIYLKNSLGSPTPHSMKITF